MTPFAYVFWSAISPDIVVSSMVAAAFRLRDIVVSSMVPAAFRLRDMSFLQQQESSVVRKNLVFGLRSNVLIFLSKQWGTTQ